MQKIIQSTDTYEKRQQQAKKVTDQFKTSISGIKNSSVSATAGIGAVTAKIGALVSATYIGKKAVGLLFDTIKTGANQQIQKNSIEALVGDDKAGDALYKYATAYGKQKSALGPLGITKATTSFLSFTKDVDKITQLYKLTERLYSKDPSQGMEGAVFAMKELLSGDTMSARGRFNISGISGKKIRDFADEGNIAGTIEYLDKTFNRFGATQAVVDKNFTSLSTQAERFKQNFVAAMGDEASPTVQNLSLLMQQLNSDMDAGKFQPFFEVVANGAVAIGNGMAWVAQNAGWLVPAIGGVVTAIVVYNTATLIANTATLLMGTTLSVVAGRWITAAALIAGAAATIGVATSLASQNSDLKKTTEDLAKAKNGYNSSLKNANIQKTIPVEISNKAPIKVKGEVEIEKESQKYFFDIAAQKAIAQFNMQMVAPQVAVHVDTVSKTTDLAEVADYLGDVVSANSGTQAQGVYS